MAFAIFESMGKPKYNLTIEVRCHKRRFEKTVIHSAEEEIEIYGTAIHWARKFLGGHWTVTDKGFLIKGFAHGLETHKAFLDVDEVLTELKCLEKAFTEKRMMDKDFLGPHLHFQEGGIYSIIYEDRGFFCRGFCLE